MSDDAGHARNRYRSVFRPGLFDGQVIIVTGGGSGIGRCTAHELASLGAKVALVGRKADKLAAVAKEIAEDLGENRASVHPCDIRLEEQVVGVVGDVLKAHGRIDGLVNNAGGQFAAPLAGISQKGWEKLAKAWSIKEPAKVNFDKEILVVATTVGSKLTLSTKLDDKGDLKILALATRDLRPGFRYAIKSVSKEGVKTVNGKELPKE